MAPAAARTLLIVEDDDAVREFFSTVLRAAGYRVVDVNDGMDALRWIDQHIPALVVLDLHLQRLSGLDLHRELQAHARTRQIPVVVVTGADTGALDREGLACVLHKPVTADALLDAVSRCLRTH